MKVCSPAHRTTLLPRRSDNSEYVLLPQQILEPPGRNAWSRNGGREGSLGDGRRHRVALRALSSHLLPTATARPRGAPTKGNPAEGEKPMTRAIRTLRLTKSAF